VSTQTEECATKLSCFYLCGGVSPTTSKVMMKACLWMIKGLTAHGPVRPKVISAWTAEQDCQQIQGVVYTKD
jgi:hypothetical protein